MQRVVVTGAGGFIGHHLVTYLKERGYWVRGVDIEVPGVHRRWTPTSSRSLDLRRWDAALQATRGSRRGLRAGRRHGRHGVHLDQPRARSCTTTLLINLHTIDAARINGVRRYLYSSTACIYPEYLQTRRTSCRCKERTPTRLTRRTPTGGRSSFTERLCLYYADEFGLETRIVRFHNIYGPFGTYDGGREKAPAAICRKVALAEDGGSDRGLGRRRADAVVLLHRRLRRGHLPPHAVGYCQPLNLGTDRMVTINELARSSSPRSPASGTSDRSTSTGPQGVRGRNSDNSRLREVLGWEPTTSLRGRAGPTYRWIEEQVARRRAPARAMRGTVAA